MFFDMRTYTLRSSRAAAWLENYAQFGYPVQVRHLGEPVLYATTEVGTQNQVVHIWGYDSLDERERKRAALWADPQWQDYLRRSAAIDAHELQENRILKSTAFSPR
jgi:hypothetical protein